MSAPATKFSPEEQLEMLSRGSEEILPEGALLARLKACAKEGRPLRVKQGFDPTAPDIHLGHTVGLWKLRQFQRLGHQVVVIIGDYTGMVGDPSGASKTRPHVDEAQIAENAKTYFEQFYKVLVEKPKPPELPVEVRHNGEWFSKMRFMDVMRLASEYTVARMLERDDFAKRYAARQPISVHELFYPLMQGYDSVAIKADVEIGGTDQKFNLLVGRAIQEANGQPAQAILTMPIIPGLDGVQKMSKSLSNYIGVTDEPRDMFGKVMSIPDALMPQYWELVANLEAEELAAVRRELESGDVNPMVIKKRLGHRIVAMYHGEEAADRAQSDFETQFSRKEVPDDLEEFGSEEVTEVAGEGREPRIVEFIVGAGLAPSKGAARRLVQQRAVSVDGERILDLETPIDAGRSFVLRVGRKMKRYKGLG